MPNQWIPISQAPKDDAIKWPKELRSLEDMPWPIRWVSRNEFLKEYPPEPPNIDT